MLFNFFSKDTARDKFLAEHPSYKHLSPYQVKLLGKKEARRIKREMKWVEHKNEREGRKKERLNKYKKRLDEVASLREQGMTLEQIGERLGVTRERIRQLSINIPNWDNTVWNKRPRKTYTFTCAHCGVDFTKRLKRSYKYCCIEHTPIYRRRLPVPIKKMSKEEWLKYNNDRTRAYYNKYYKGTERGRIIHKKNNERQLELKHQKEIDKIIKMYPLFSEEYIMNRLPISRIRLREIVEAARTAGVIK